MPTRESCWSIRAVRAGQVSPLDPGRAVPGRGRCGLRLDRVRPPRVGASAPRLSCDNPTSTAPGPTTTATSAHWRTSADPDHEIRGSLQGSGRRLRITSGPPTPSPTWTASGSPCGVEKINYYGFSYGTYLGQVYATLHPDRCADGPGRHRRPATRLVRRPLSQGCRVREGDQRVLRWIASGTRSTAWASLRPRSARVLSPSRRLAPQSDRANVGPDEFARRVPASGLPRTQMADVADASRRLIGKEHASAMEKVYQRHSDFWRTTTASRLQRDPVQRTWRGPPSSASGAPTPSGPPRRHRSTPGQLCTEPLSVLAAKRASREGRRPGLPDLLLTGGNAGRGTPFSGAIEVRDRFAGARLSRTGAVTHANSCRATVVWTTR